ncbi:hypothetical protein FQR65_LT01642 [Abscondita terminalis]|nr:hypothetical protein FQR65_LT01642 [Abscondita terminalis]
MYLGKFMNNLVQELDLKTAEINSHLLQKISKDVNSIVEAGALSMKSETLSSRHSNFPSVPFENHECQNRRLYANVAAPASQSKVIIQPTQTPKQNINKTKKDILKEIDPISENISIKNVKPLKDGSLLLSCSNKEQSKNLIKKVEEKLSQSYKTRPIKAMPIKFIKFIKYAKLKLELNISW